MRSTDTTKCPLAQLVPSKKIAARGAKTNSSRWEPRCQTAAGMVKAKRRVWVSKSAVCQMPPLLKRWINKCSSIKELMRCKDMALGSLRRGILKRRKKQRLDKRWPW